MNHFSLGFYFNPTFTEVVLIRKTHPPTQYGKLNGPGGRIESGESGHDCIVRKFEEETGIRVPKWDRFAVLQGEGPYGEFSVQCFKASGLLDGIRTKTSEAAYIMPIHTLPELKTVANTKWLIRMALDIIDDTTSEFIISEKYKEESSEHTTSQSQSSDNRKCNSTSAS